MKLSITSALLAALMVAGTSEASLRAAKKQGRFLAQTVVSDHMVSKTDKILYQCSFASSWSSANQPVDYPLEAHTSPPVLVAHNANYKMFTPGQPASDGVKEVAETGKFDILTTELTDAGDDVASIIAGVPMFWATKEEIDAAAQEVSPSSGAAGDGNRRRRTAETDSISVEKGGDPIYGVRSQTLSSKLVFDPEHTMFTGISMLAPSPDWFSASHGTSVVTTDDEWNEVWLKSFKYETLPYDAGTDSGVTFKSEDLPTTPAEGIAVFTVDNNDAGIFVNADGTEVLPIYTWECAISEVMYKEEDGMMEDGMVETNESIDMESMDDGTVIVQNTEESGSAVASKAIVALALGLIAPLFL